MNTDPERLLNTKAALRLRRSWERDDLDAAATWALNISNTEWPGLLLVGSSANTVDELNALTIRIAIHAGWRGATDDDLREIRRMLACTLGDGRASGPAALTYWHPSATAEGLSEALGWVADDAIEYLCDVLAPFDLMAMFDDGMFIVPVEDEA